MKRFERFQAIQQLDPVRDTCEICRQLAGYEFPWDVTRAFAITKPTSELENLPSTCF